MEFKFIKSLLIGFALSCGLSASAQDMTGKKFYVGVSSNGTAVNATVYDNYNFVVELPESGKKVDVSNFTVDAIMHNVATLGLAANEIRRSTINIETGAQHAYTELSGWMPNTYNFIAANCAVKVIDIDKTTKDLSYDIEKNDLQITGRTNESDARAAWRIITSHVENGKNNEIDSNIEIISGTYIIMGNERMDFTSNVTLMNGPSWTTRTESDKLWAAATVNTISDDSYAKKAFVYLPAGSTITLGHSYAKLTAPAKITIDLSNANNTLNGMLSNLNSKTSGNNAAEAMQYMISDIFDVLVGRVSEAEDFSVTVDFSNDDAFIQVYPGSETPLEQLKTIEEFQEIQKTYVNAIGIASEDYYDAIHNATLNNNLTNVVIEYAAGKHGNYYYECENLVLTDHNSSINAAYYSPVNFTAITGKYYRKMTMHNAACVLPFSLGTSDFTSEGETKILTFSYYEPIYKNGEITDRAWVYFNKREKINAGVPCFLYNSSNSTELDITFDFTPIVGTPDNSSNMQGFFVKTLLTPEVNYGYLTIGQSDKTLTPCDGYTANPFRSVLYKGYNQEYNDGQNNPENNTTNAKVFLMAIIDEDGNTTDINGVQIDKENIISNTIYTVDGRQIEQASKPGLYIINGKKKYIKY